MDNRLKIICDGDSWVFGCEIADPSIIEKYPSTTYVGEYDFLEENDNYRIPKIFPTHLAELLDAEVTNLAWPADDNSTIINRTISYISSNYLAKNIPTDNLLVIVGWSSPERNSFWYKDEKTSYRFRLWPQVPLFETEQQKQFWELYVSYFWNSEEYMTRYVMNVLQLQNFCDSNGIKWMCFNSFYQTPTKDISEWNDLDVKNELKDLKLNGCSYRKSNHNTRQTYMFEYNSLWETINPIRFYKKDLQISTFKNFIDNSNLIKKYNGWHPSPESHRLWAEELSNYIKLNNLI
jgi:hypothetical protein